MRSGLRVRRSQGFQDVGAAGDDLDVGLWLRHADQLDTGLVELALAALLRALVTEHRPGIEDLKRHLLGETAGDESTRHAGRVLRAQGDAGALLVFGGLLAAHDEGVHLLGHDVGGVAEGALEHLGELEDRGGHLLEAVALGDRARGLDHPAVTAHGIGQKVVGAPDGLQAAHGKFRFR
jgi:hypothetical protein